MDLVSRIDKAYLKPTTASFGVGDTVEVKVKILEGDKERLQSFIGTVIRRKGRGMRENFTVRRIVEGEGVERVFPLNSPKIGEISVLRKGRVRRARLYYLRKLTGKASKVKERIGGAGDKHTESAPPATAAHPAAAEPAPPKRAPRAAAERAAVGEEA